MSKNPKIAFYMVRFNNIKGKQVPVCGNPLILCGPLFISFVSYPEHPFIFHPFSYKTLDVNRRVRNRG